MDKPNFEGAKEELAKRTGDVLEVGDVVQEWAFKRSDDRGLYRWLNGDVIAVVVAPCDGMEWVAMVQWHERGNVRCWTTLTSLAWRNSILFRRKPKRKK